MKKIKNIVKSMWNSKLFETMAEVNFEAMAFLGECICDALSNSSTNSNDYKSFSNNETTNKEDSFEEMTYNYWSNLSYQEQEEYFNNNLTLQKYGENYRYTDRHQMAKSMADIARREGRSFIDKYDRY